MALRDHMSCCRINKLGIPFLSSELDKLDRIEVQKLFHETFRDSNLQLTIFTLKTPSERSKSGDHNATDSRKTQTIGTGINQGLTWVRQEFRPPRSHLQGLLRDVWKLWSLFHELKTRILCRKHQKAKTTQTIFQKVVPLASVQDKLHSFHSDHMSSHL